MKGVARFMSGWIVLVPVLLFFLVRYLEKVSIFYPSKEMTASPAVYDFNFDEVFFTASDGVKLHGWLMKTNPQAPVILYLHGNAGNIADRLEKAAQLMPLGLNLFLIDYRGYGRSDGKPSEAGIYLDGQAAYDELMRRGFKEKDVVAYGASLGGAVAVNLATKRTLGALIIDSSFTSAADMARRLYPYLPTFLMAVKLDSKSYLDRLTLPKLIMHSPEDELVPFAMGQELFNRAPEPKTFLQTKGRHNDNYLADHDLWFNGIRDFLKNQQLLPKG